MPDRIVVLAQNGRHSTRGVSVVGPQEFQAYQDDTDELTYTFDLSNYLEGATISSVTRTADGPTVSNTSNSTTRIIQRLKGYGFVDIKATLSTGDIDTFRITIRPRTTSRTFWDDYR